MHLLLLGSFIKPFPGKSVTQSFTQVLKGDKYFPNVSIQLFKHMYLLPNLLLYFRDGGHSFCAAGKHFFVS